MVPPKKINHALHAVLTLFTCGAWLLVWVTVAIVARKKAKVIYPDGTVGYRS